MILPESKQLDIGKFSRIFDNKSESYKLFWFKAILKNVIAGKREMTFEDLIDEMLCEAWYMVTEYHLNLGPKDGIEGIVNDIYSEGKLASNASPSEIKKYLHDDKKIIDKKRMLSYNVPYRLQAPFLDWKGKDWEGSKDRQAERINTYEGMIYSFSEINSFGSKIKIDDTWAEYLTENQEILLGWIDYNMIIYLQRRNPNVPGIIDKLRPPEARKLDKVKKYWKMVAEETPIYDIFGGQKITSRDISIDHFIPWSYVAHDELWNLHPVTRSVNSSKSNNLPDWNEYFYALCENEYKAYEIIWEREKIHDAFESCLSQHINSDELRYSLYRKGISKAEFCGQLEATMLPVYQSAKNLGFKIWRY